MTKPSTPKALSSVRERQPDGKYFTLPESQWQADSAAGNAETKPYSVLLLYPDYLDDSGYETLYVFVEATDAIHAVAVAQRQVADAQSEPIDDPTDFHPLLVTAGHHSSEPLWNK